MKVKEYISSGILETYVLGHCTPEEAQEVERQMLGYPEVKEEVEAIRNSLQTYVNAFGKTPPASLKNKIWEAIEAEKPVGKIIAMNQRPVSTGPAKWLVAASLILFGLAACMNVYLYSKWKAAERQVAEIQTQNEYFASQFKIEQANYAALQQQLNFVQNPSTKTIYMKGTAQHPEALATIFWNTTTKEVFLKTNSLPQEPSGKQYQLCAIVDGAPVNAGMITSEPGNFQKMLNFSNAQAFAVTLEPVGGSSAPTMDEMYVIGNI